MQSRLNSSPLTISGFLGKFERCKCSLPPPRGPLCVWFRAPGFYACLLVFIASSTSRFTPFAIMAIQLQLSPPLRSGKLWIMVGSPPQPVNWWFPPYIFMVFYGMCTTSVRNQSPSWWDSKLKITWDRDIVRPVVPCRPTRGRFGPPDRNPVGVIKMRISIRNVRG